MPDKSCPAYRPDNCFITGTPCEYKDKHHCMDYRLYVPRRPMSREVFEGTNINKLLSETPGLSATIMECMGNLGRREK